MKKFLAVLLAVMMTLGLFAMTAQAEDVLTIIWWEWADWSGYTKRKAMEREEQRKQERIAKHHEAIGTKVRPPVRRR